MCIVYFGWRFEHREENRKDCLRTLYSLIEEAGKARKLAEDARTSYVKGRLRANSAFMERLHAKTMRIRESDTVSAWKLIRNSCPWKNTSWFGIMIPLYLLVSLDLWLLRDNFIAIEVVFTGLKGKIMRLSLQVSCILLVADLSTEDSLCPVGKKASWMLLIFEVIMVHVKLYSRSDTVFF